MSRFDDCLAFVFKAEGGYSDGKTGNSAFDRGGPTQFGVTQDSYNSYRTRHHLPFQPVKYITRDEARDIYREDYWSLLCCDRLPKPLDLVVFDAGVNCGVRSSAKFLQRALGVDDDGIIGGKTIQAVVSDQNSGMVGHVVSACLDERRSYYIDLCERRPDQLIFKNGWLNRIDRLQQLVESEVK